MTPELLAELADRFGSPLYVYDLAAVRQAHAALAASLPSDAELLYSLKANPHPAVVRTLVERGCGAEVSSVGELDVALAVGADPGRALYTGPGKTIEEIDAAMAAGVRWFSADSPYDVAKIGAVAGRAGVRAQVVLRVNPGEGATGAGLLMTGESSPFGADDRWIARDPHAFTHPDVDVVGFHVFLASNLASTDAVLHATRIGLDAVEPLAAALGRPLDLLDLGGGFGHPFARPGPRPDLRALRAPLEELLAERRPALGGVGRVAFESGRYLTGACGRLVATVQDVKRSRSRSFAVLDSGIHHLGGMYGLRRVPSLGVEVLPAPSQAGPSDGAGGPSAVPGPLGGPFDLVGPLCTPLDAWARNTDLAPLAVGDRVVVPNVGAYGLSASLIAFLSRSLPTEVVVDGDTVVDVSRLTLTRTAGLPRPSAREAPAPERLVTEHA